MKEQVQSGSSRAPSTSSGRRCKKRNEFIRGMDVDEVNAPAPKRPRINGWGSYRTTFSKPIETHGRGWGKGASTTIRRAQLRPKTFGIKRAFGGVADVSVARDIVAARLRDPCNFRTYARRISTTGLSKAITSAKFLSNNLLVSSTNFCDQEEGVTLHMLGSKSGSYNSLPVMRLKARDLVSNSSLMVRDLFDIGGGSFSISCADSSLRIVKVGQAGTYSIERRAFDQSFKPLIYGYGSACNAELDKSPFDENTFMFCASTGEAGFAIGTSDIRMPHSAKNFFSYAKFDAQSAGPFDVSSARYGESENLVLCALKEGLRTTAFAVDLRMTRQVLSNSSDLVGLYSSPGKGNGDTDVIWNKHTAAFETQFHGHDPALGGIYDVRAFGAGLVLTSEYRDVHKLWQTEKSRGFVTFREQGGACIAATLNSMGLTKPGFMRNRTAVVGDGRRFYSISGQNACIVNEWRLDSLAHKNDIIPCFQYHFPEEIVSIVADKDGQALAFGSAKGHLVVTRANGL